MTLTELRYIVALARERHFGRAAEKCFVAQPTLSVAVKKLEDELGVILFERGQSEVTVTPAGVPVVEQAARVLAEAARVKELADTAGDPLAGPLRLGAIHTIGPYLLPRLVPLIKARAPKMPLMIVEGLTAQLIEALKSGELDVAVLALPVEEPGLVVQPVYDEAFRVLVPQGHAWAKQKQVNADHLLDEPLLMLGRGNCFRDQVLDLCTRAGAGGPQVLEGSSLETIRLMVASGVGITVMPSSAVDTLPKDDPLLCVRPFAAPTPTRRVGLVWRVSFPRHQAIDLMRRVLLDCKLPGIKPVR
ncbi:MAG: LysR family transcriptional regulator [Gammaproteobacteria bacterium]|nr:LysR family transcriptional regulator [Rhodocyclaceae bacterium]MBU3909804.1 LysR family transcriptional regulator [Gammaproteobacteria bacterium]MBU3989847.1 LysR family transcriptional regulator [Gammaproteobacteria bacterium]MBU4003046.1 LysR family transcriptional regulator [Gammaproteobacteria bacterium]MBU4019871.1 LysR family transcriptional regulator [Gammaproteobacteria bacterium]